MSRKSALSFFIFLFLIINWSCSDNQKVGSPTIKKTKIKIIEKEYHFGKILDSDTVFHRYSILNTGKYDLIINDVKASCGCTNLNWTKTPIRSGDTAFISVVFIPNSTGRNEKSIIVNANTDSIFTVLYLKGDVEKSR